MTLTVTVDGPHRSVAHSLLVKIDRYLWSRQPVALSPQLQVLEEREREGRRRGEGLEQVLPHPSTRTSSDKVCVWLGFDSG